MWWWWQARCATPNQHTGMSATIKKEYFVSYLCWCVWHLGLVICRNCTHTHTHTNTHTWNPKLIWRLSVVCNQTNDDGIPNIWLITLFHKVVITNISIISDLVSPMMAINWHLHMHNVFIRARMMIEKPISCAVLPSDQFGLFTLIINGRHQFCEPRKFIDG